MTPTDPCLDCRVERTNEGSRREPDRATHVLDDGERTHYLCALHYEARRRSPVAATWQRIFDAEALLDRDPSTIVTWPYRALDDVCGPLPRGSITYVAAFSGGGKTSFITNVIGEWLAAGVRCYIMPLESRPHEWATRFACASLAIAPGDALSGRLRLQEAAGNDMARLTRIAIRDKVRRQRDEPLRDQLYVAPDSLLTFKRFEQNLRHAAAIGAGVVIVDHVDHVEGDVTGGSPTQASETINRRAGDLAGELDLAIVFTTQMNLESVRGNHDQLARYAPPREHQLWRPGPKIQVATQILGLFRPLADDAAPENVKRARAGEIDPPQVLAPARMGVVAMKLRHYGEHTGTKMTLAYERGFVRPLNEKEQLAETAKQHGIHTNRDI